MTRKEYMMKGRVLLTKKAAERIEKVKSLFPQQDFGLTKSQSWLLAAIACSDGHWMTESEILKAGISSSAAQRSEDLDVLLNEKRLISRNSSWGKTYSVMPTSYMRVALDAMLYWPEVVERVKEARHLGDSPKFRLVKSLVEEDNPVIPEQFKSLLYYDTSPAEMMEDVLTEPVFDPVFRSLPASLNFLAAEFRLGTLAIYNILTASDLEAVEAFAKKYLKGDPKARMFEMVGGMRYLLTGELREDLDAASGKSEWPAAVTAIASLYRGDYDNAAGLMEKSLRIRNVGAEKKNIFDYQTLAYFQILSYLLQDNDKSRKKLSQYLNKKFDDWVLRCQQQPAILLAELSAGATDAKISDEIFFAGRNNFNTTSRILVGGIAESRGLEVPFKRPRSVFAIIRHELGDGTPEEKAAWEKLYGGPSLLSRLKVKKPWEIALDNLNDILDKTLGSSSPDKPAETKDRRICYIIYDQYEVEIREQSRLKNGNWGKGKIVSMTSFRQGAYNDICDDLDLKVQPRVFDYGYNNIGTILPALIGCGRVFKDSYAPENRVEVAEELPFVEIRLKKNFYEFSTNVPYETYTSPYNLESYVSRDPLHYSVIRLNKVQSQVLLSLKESGITFPEEATEALKAFIDKLSHVIEVHSPLLESGSSLEEKQGSPMLYLRIIPKSGNFDALLYVRPLENGKLTFYPGEGDTTYYDSDDSARYQVKRDIRGERASLETLFSKTGLEDFDSEDGLYYLSPMDMLPVVDACRELVDICTLEWPQGRSLKVIGNLDARNINIKVSSKERWFEIEGDAQLPDGRSLTIEQIMSAIASGGYGNGYLKLGESDYVSLSDSLAKYLKRLEAVTQSGRGGGRVSLFQTGALADIVHKSHLNIKTDKAYLEKLAKVEESATLNPAVPSGLKAELRDYQEIGFRWMVRLDHWGAGACLADDMGLGKTVQTIAFLLYKAAKGASLVVAPASVLMNWSRELARFAPSLKVTVLNEQDDRAVALSGLGEYDVVLTTYGLLVREKEALTAVEWNVICLDEAHTIKNRGTKMSEAAMSLKSGSRVILTGTPVQNYLGELWNLFQFLNPGLLGSYEAFSQKFIMPIENLQDKDRQNQLKRMIQPFMLRRTKSEVVEELPEKTEIFRSVPMSASETVAYEAMRLEAKNELEQDTRMNMNALAAITRLREAACAMPLVRNGWAEEPTKVSALRELVGDIICGGNSVLVFSQFTGFLDIVSAMLEKEGINHFYLQGSTPLKKRQDMVNGFQRGEKPVFLISLKAGGLGLNLTGANYVIHLDPWWNPAIEQQATDRAYRIGQQQNVTVYHLIAANSIEEKILRLHKTKQNLADAILEGTSVSHAITLDELRELIR